MTEIAYLTAADLLLGSQGSHDVIIPAAILNPQSDPATEGASPDSHNGSGPQKGQRVRVRPLSLATMTLISRAARDDASLVPILMIKEAVIEPPLTLDQIRHMHVGLVHYLVAQINRLSGLGADGSALDQAVNSSLGQTHLLLAKHFGWTPDQVSQLTPGQVAVYLAGIEKLMAWEQTHQEGT
ncbi:MAG: hypothetical protein VKJ24_10795 [Synechococcales bacterium]|nr:hypothetical protein [Synechococcales bacterium]